MVSSVADRLREIGFVESTQENCFELLVGECFFGAGVDDDYGLLLFAGRPGAGAEMSQEALKTTATPQAIADAMRRMYHEQIGQPLRGPIADLAERYAASRLLGGRVVHLSKIAREVSSEAFIMRGVSADEAEDLNGVMAYCLAFQFDELTRTAEVESTTWHEWLLRHTIAALWETHRNEPVLAAYMLHPGLCRLFLCSRQSEKIGRLHDLLALRPAYVEAGQDIAVLHYLRPLAYWEPPSTMAALWPLPSDDTPGPFAFDAASHVSYSSYPLSDHDSGVAIEDAGPDYVRVPTSEHGSFLLSGREYHYLNWWNRVEW